MTRPLILTFTLILLTLTTVLLWATRGSEPAVTGGPAEQAAAIGGSFTLTDQHGKTVQDADFRGKLMLVFFGFTHCPDVCPVALTTLTHVMKALGDAGAQVAPVFITVDPERDTPARLATFLKDFHPSLTGLTGSKDALEEVQRAYKVYAAAQEQASGTHDEMPEHPAADYLVDHSALMYLMGRNGEYVAHFTLQTPEDTIVDAIRAQLK